MLGTAALVNQVKNGLPAASFRVLRDAIEVSTERLARLVRISPRTLARRKVLTPDESERILRIGQLFQRAIGVLGDETEARSWLLAPQKALGGATPLDYAETEPGGRAVEDLLGRLEHGVFS
ncbi:MAG: DUF2384 domain-containing protein [Verrucomicrobia bacterium]|nr:DUF2384 domain-containing protein [Verrucomicrobiota bacterium]